MSQDESPGFFAFKGLFYISKQALLLRSASKDNLTKEHMEEPKKPSLYEKVDILLDHSLQVCDNVAELAAAALMVAGGESAALCNVPLADAVSIFIESYEKIDLRMRQKVQDAARASAVVGSDGTVQETAPAKYADKKYVDAAVKGIIELHPEMLASDVRSKIVGYLDNTLADEGKIVIMGLVQEAINKTRVDIARVRAQNAAMVADLASAEKWPEGTPPASTKSKKNLN